MFTKTSHVHSLSLLKLNLKKGRWRAVNIEKGRENLEQREMIQGVVREKIQHAGFCESIALLSPS